MRLLRPSRLLGRAGRLLGRTLAFLAPLALKFGATRRVLSTLIGVAVAMIVVAHRQQDELLRAFGGG
jgi:hypothetical protein